MLYNFFEDSPATANQWRLILNGVADRENLQVAPAFDETRHASICVEVRPSQHKPFFSPHSCHLILQLKFLYVAITRARQNLWIVDSSESAEPMKVPRNLVITICFLHHSQKYWDSRGQISIRTSTDEMPTFAVESTTEEWLMTAKMLVMGSRIIIHHTMTAPTGCSVTGTMNKLQTLFEGLGGTEKLGYAMRTTCKRKLR